MLVIFSFFFFLFTIHRKRERIQQRDSVVIVAFVIVALVCVFVIITLYVVVNGQKSPHQSCGNQYSAVHSSTVLNVCLGAFAVRLCVYRKIK